MFNCIWSNTEWTIEEQQLAVKSLQSKTLLTADKCLMVSAATMSLLQCFDEKKIHFLLDAVDSPEISISVRAMTGIIFTTKNYSQRIELYPELIARLQLLKDDKDFGDLMARIYIQLLQTKNTPNLTDKIQNEILPEMMDGLKNGLPGSDEDDSNPEWKRFSPKLTEKIQKIQDLMMEGADVYVQTFSMLKRFPFFNSVSNWFLPYFPQHSLVSASVDNDPENEQVMDIIMNSSGICDSDKYSMLCVFPSIPAGQRNLIMSQFTSEENRELIEENQEMLKEMSQTREALSNNYIHCIYRFFKFYNKRHEFHDIFNDRLDFYNSKLLSDFLTTPERLKEVYESMMKGEMYSDACRVFEQMDRMNCMSETDLQKAAYCEQKSKNYKMALAYLHRVEEILPSDLWTIRHLATCHRKNKEYEEALRYYHKAGVRQPENLTIAYHTAQCLVELERYNEALQPFFQIDLTTDDDPKVCRGIAKCSFMIQKEDQAQRYLNKINPESRQGEDYILEGHIYLLTGDKRKALECYQMGANMMKLKETAKDFNQEFEQTIPKLLQRGLDLEEIQMIRDLVN